MRTERLGIALLLSLLAVATLTGAYYETARFSASQMVAGNLTVNDDLSVTDDATVTGILTSTEALVVDGRMNHNVSSSALTSPTVEIAVAGRSVIELTADANLTGLWLSGGNEGDTVEIYSGAGAHTMRFDDSTSVVCGGNITLTEGQSDSITFRCAGTGHGTVWRCIAAHDN